VSITDLALYSATDEEMSVNAPQASAKENTQYFNLAGLPSAQPQKGLNVVRTGSKSTKVLVK
jgi:hypothetical protein